MTGGLSNRKLVGGKVEVDVAEGIAEDAKLPLRLEKGRLVATWQYAVKSMGLSLPVVL